MKEHIEIYIFKRAKICSNSSHKIAFDDDNDIYNPFSMKNLALSSCIEDGSLVEHLYEFAVMHDLTDKKCFNDLEHKMFILAKHQLSKVLNDNKHKFFYENVPLAAPCMKASMKMTCT